MRMKARTQRAVSLAGIVSLVIMPALALAQYTAPAPEMKKEKSQAIALNNTGSWRGPETETRVEILHVTAGNPENLEPGFYASYKPKAFDTVFIYEGGTEQCIVIGVHSGKEVLH